MTLRSVLLLTLVLGLAACGSRFNPANWARGSDNEVALIPEGGFLSETETREVVSQVTDLRVEKASGGVIIRAVGLPPRQGYWAGELVSDTNDKPENGVLTYTFRIAEPYALTREGTPYSRQVIVGHFVSNVKLRGVTSIRVLGAQNSRSVRR
ncbi:hypothetical protein [Aliiroseovarius subalbicans]|uniref:hypothetical protein n=1 Tax=Aliiroseovarius subalbicans TaxID=2925840 RepID=UPI001F57F722|nr:hypothetical protein [Aliiroseovarius subalbicans]MCI2398199.1 hypothetical protein [Aliiroseovarius subalbicans]